MQMHKSILSCIFLAATVVFPSHAEADLDLILYGAYGCVGHFAAGHLANQTGLKWAIAGRNGTSLKALATNLAAAGGPSSQPEIIVASLDGKTDASTWVKRAKAVISAAGPFSIHGGEYVVKAAAENGVHYSDTSDEFYWQRWMADRHDASARKSGARVVLSSGFCALAGDLGSQLAIKALGPMSKTDTVAVDAWLEEYNGGLSAGVLNTRNAMKNASFPKAWNTDPYVLAPNASQELRVDTIVEGLKLPSWDKKEGPVVSNLFGPYDARLLRRTFTRLGQRIQARFGAPPSMYTKWTAFLAVHPGAWSSLSKCPAPPVYDGGSWSYRFRASVANSSATSEVLLSGKKDPGYHFTGFGLAEAGLCLAGKTTNCLNELGGGVFTTMSTMDPAVIQKRLESVGLLDTPSVQVSVQMEKDGKTLFV